MSFDLSDELLDVTDLEGEKILSDLVLKEIISKET